MIETATKKQKHREKTHISIGTQIHQANIGPLMSNLVPTEYVVKPTESVDERLCRISFECEPKNGLSHPLNLK